MKKLLSILLLLSVFSVYAANNNILCSIEYFYSDDGMLIGKAINGNRINYEYDLRGQLLSVKDTNGKVLESYTYDKVGNILSKTVNGKTTTYTYDKANQLISSTIDGKTTNYKYDAAGRMIQAGSKTYRYKYLDKVAEVRENGKVIAEFEYTVEGQVSTATYGDKTEEFMWDGLALIQRNDISYLNEPYVTGGNPILADNDVMFNDMLGNTVAINGKSIDMTAFGETENTDAMFTGKPHVAELGYTFLFRNYDSSLGKWSTSDPLGYPDGWNNFAYLNNVPYYDIDFLGAWSIMKWLYTGNGNATDNEYEAAVSAVAEIMGMQVAANLFNTTEQVTYDIIKNGQGTMQIGFSASGGGSTGGTFGFGIVLGYGITDGWQCGVYITEGMGSYIGVGGSCVVDLTISANDSIYDLGGNAITVGGSGSNNGLSIGGEVTTPLGGDGALPSVSVMAGTLVIPAGTPAEVHTFLTRTQILSHNDIFNYIYRNFYE